MNNKFFDNMVIFDSMKEIGGSEEMMELYQFWYMEEWKLVEIEWYMVVIVAH